MPSHTSGWSWETLLAYITTKFSKPIILILKIPISNLSNFSPLIVIQNLNDTKILFKFQKSYFSYFWERKDFSGQVGNELVLCSTPQAKGGNCVQDWCYWLSFADPKSIDLRIRVQKIPGLRSSNHCNDISAVLEFKKRPDAFLSSFLFTLWMEKKIIRKS